MTSREMIDKLAAETGISEEDLRVLVAGVMESHKMSAEEVLAVFVDSHSKGKLRKPQAEARASVLRGRGTEPLVLE